MAVGGAAEAALSGGGSAMVDRLVEINGHPDLPSKICDVKPCVASMANMPP